MYAVDGKSRKEKHGMAARYRIVLIDWVDGDVSDTDEIRVYADSDHEAVSKAKQRWRMTIGSQWPHCRIEKAETLATARLRGVV